MDIRLHIIVPLDLPRVHACTHVDKVIRVLVCMYKDYKFLSMFSDIIGCYGLDRVYNHFRFPLLN